MYRDVREWGPFNPNTDITTVLHAALADMKTTGGTLGLPVGAGFLCSATSVVPVRVRLIGASQGDSFGGTELKLADGANCDVLQVDDAGGTNWWHYGEIAHLSINGNKLNNTVGNGLNFGRMGETSSIHHIYSHDCPQDGYYGGAGTPNNLAWVSSFNNNGYGFNLINVGNTLNLWAPSGDGNIAGLIHITNPATGALCTINIIGMKAERANILGITHDPCIFIDNFVGSVNILGGAINGNGTSPATVTNALTRSGAQGLVQVRGLRIGGYATQYNDVANGAYTVSRGTGTTVLNVDTSQSPGMLNTMRAATAWTGASVGTGWFQEVWISCPGAQFGDVVSGISASNSLGGQWFFTGEVYIDAGTPYVLTRLWNMGAAATPNPGTVTVQVTPLTNR